MKRVNLLLVTPQEQHQRGMMITPQGKLARMMRKPQKRKIKQQKILKKGSLRTPKERIGISNPLETMRLQLYLCDLNNVIKKRNKVSHIMINITKCTKPSLIKALISIITRQDDYHHHQNNEYANYLKLNKGNYNYGQGINYSNLIILSVIINLNNTELNAKEYAAKLVNKIQHVKNGNKKFTQTKKHLKVYQLNKDSKQQIQHA